MKGLLAGLCLLVSGGAFAQFGGANCTYQLLDEYNREVMRIDAYSCGDAQVKCEQERAYQEYNNLIDRGYCQQVQTGGYNPNPGGYNPNPGGYNPNPGGYNPNPGGYNPGGQYSQCETSLQNGWGQTFQTFYGYDCTQALATCDQARILRQTPYEALYCRITAGSGSGSNPGGNPGGYWPQPQAQCTFELKDVRNQRIVNQFMNTAVNEQQACELSYNQCQTSARSYNGYSGIQNYVCQKRTNGGGYNPGQGQYTTQSCIMRIVSPSGTFLESVSATASGYGQVQAKQQACAQAEVSCRNVINSKVIPGRPSPYFQARCVQQ